MTQTVTEKFQKLAEAKCLSTSCEDGHWFDYPHMPCELCQGTGLAFPGLSEECDWCTDGKEEDWPTFIEGVPSLQWKPCRYCQGSNRIPLRQNRLEAVLGVPGWDSAYACEDGLIRVWRASAQGPVMGEANTILEAAVDALFQAAAAKGLVKAPA